MATGDLPTWDALRAAVNVAATLDGEWSGCPIPVHGLPLVIEPRYPYAGLNGECFGPNELRDPLAPLPGEQGLKVRNHWYSRRRHVEVYVVEEDGKSSAIVRPAEGGRITPWVGTLGAMNAWSIEAEQRAQETLRGLISEHAWKCYFLTGTFLETSKRSHVTYLFRRGRPTVALHRDGDGMAILAVLCLHPIGHYQGTFAGVMVPSDDVIAHLMLMRGDEHCLWKKANHHPLWSSSAGI